MKSTNKLFKEKIKTSIILIEREKERKENEWKSDDEPTLIKLLRMIKRWKRKKPLKRIPEK
ncbi:MAG: hypothetical protein GY737_05700 [Desulfobacteraceae bacterium]|nr:hypothetical protein [Desulfobacteraceae bacterium]